MPHTVLMAEPRGFCAGVVRAIDVLDTKIDGDAQLGLYQQVGRLVHAASA